MHSVCHRYKNFIKKGFIQQLIKIFSFFLFILFFGTYSIGIQKSYLFKNNNKGIFFILRLIILFTNLLISLCFHPFFAVFSVLLFTFTILLTIFIPCYSGILDRIIENMFLKFY